MKKESLLIFLIGLVFLSQVILPQDLLWVSQFTGTGDNIPFRSIVDNNNNTYIIGAFTGTVYQGDDTLISKGDRDGFIAKYDEAGNLLWLNQIGGILLDVISGVSLSASQDTLFVAGHFQQTCYFGDSTLVSSGNYDGFLAKYLASDGSLIWDKRITWGPTATNQFIFDLTIDKNNILIMAGNFTSAAYFSSDTLYSNANKTNFMAQFDTDGNLIKAYPLYGNHDGTTIYTVVPMKHGYCFGGFYRNSVYFDFDTITTGSNTLDMFFYKTDTLCDVKWVRKIGGTGADQLWSVTVDNNDNIYIGGHFDSPLLTIDSSETDVSAENPGTKGGRDIFFAKYDDDGILQWFNVAGSTGDERLYRSVFNHGNFIVAGQFGGELTIDNETITPIGGLDVFGLVYDSYDNLVYTVSIGGSGSDLGETSVIDNEGNFIFIGDFTSSALYFGDEDTIYNAASGRDMFIAKYNKMSVDMVVTQPTCYGGSNGSISVTPQGIGEEPFTYQWAHSPTTQNVSDLATGWYKVTVTDNTGYVVVDSAFVGQPSAVNVVLTDASDVSCSGGSNGAIDITVSGGITPYAYTWSSPDGSGLYSTQQDQDHLTIGTYTVVVRDYNFCRDTLANILIGEPSPISITGDVDSVSAFGAGDGAIDITVTGGTTPYSFSWSNDSTTEDINSLDGGTYMVTVTDDNGCTKDTSYFVYEPDALLICGCSVTNISCEGLCDGSIDITVSGGNPGYTYVWKRQGQTDTLTTNQDIFGRCEGNYYVTVTDKDGSGTSINSPVYHITEPAKLQLGLFAEQITCYGLNNGAIDAQIIGGTGDKTHHWTKLGDPTFNKYTEDISDLSKGFYTDTCRDANGCEAVESEQVTEPPSLAVSVDEKDVSCNIGPKDGSICLTPSGGTSPYTYLWNNGKTTSCITLLGIGNYSCLLKDKNNCQLNVGPYSITRPAAILLTDQQIYPVSCYGLNDGWAVITPTGGRGDIVIEWTGPINGTGDTLYSMPYGTYYLVGTDTNNCIGEGQLNMTQPVSLALGIDNQQNIACMGDSTGVIAVSASGGTGAYTYQWSTIDGGGIVAGDTLQSALSAGSYKISVFDANLCEDSTATPVTLTEPATRVSIIEDTGGHQDVSCNGGANGILALTAADGTSPYEYSINGTDWLTNNTFGSLAANTYSLWVRDVTPCVATSALEITITEPDAITIDSVKVTPESAVDANDGRITVYLRGGTDTLYFTITPGITQTDSLFTALPPGEYSLSITDVNDCGPVEYGPATVGEYVSINDMTSQYQVIAYPNPTKGKTSIRLNGYEKSSIRVEIVNINGQKVMDKIYHKTDSLIEIDLSAQAEGIYILKLNGTNTGLHIIKE